MKPEKRECFCGDDKMKETVGCQCGAYDYNRCYDEYQAYLPDAEELDKLIREWCIQREDQVGVLTMDLATTIARRLGK